MGGLFKKVGLSSGFANRPFCLLKGEKSARITRKIGVGREIWDELALGWLHFKGLIRGKRVLGGEPHTCHLFFFKCCN